tara:strand:+ start:994 stop:1824 length:831 start_codon:yes stop_codon:yes gene_type:complete
MGTTIGNLIKYLDSKIYKDYILERYSSGVKTVDPKQEFHFNAPVFRKKSVLKNLKSISDLPKEHPARIIIEKRKLPSESYSDLYLCESFYKFTNSLIPNKFPSLDGDHPRLLIPFRDKDGEVFAYQGRSFGDEIPKYITIKLDSDADKIFGLDKVDMNKKIYVVEGPIDSLFLDNCIAVAGADFNNVQGDVTVIYDNEPRNKEIVKQIEKTINQGRSIVLWPDTLKEKDINDMILSGYTKSQIQKIIKDNTFEGVAAKLRFTKWKKIDERSISKTI